MSIPCIILFSGSSIKIPAYEAHRIASKISDPLAAIHFIGVHIIFLLGRTTSLFSFMKTPDPGRDFIFQYIDLPVVAPIRQFHFLSSGGMGTILEAEAIFVAATVLYSLLTYFAVRFFLYFVR